MQAELHVLGVNYLSHLQIRVFFLNYVRYSFEFVFCEVFYSYGFGFLPHLFLDTVTDSFFFTFWSELRIWVLSSTDPWKTSVCYQLGSNGVVANCKDQKDSYVGDEAESECLHETLKNPMEHGMVTILEDRLHQRQ